MDTLMIILKIVLIVLCGVGIYYLFIFSSYFWSFSEFACKFLEKAVTAVSRPFGFIWDFGKEKLGFHRVWHRKDAIARFADRHPTLGTATSIKFFIIAFISLCIIITISILRGNFDDSVENLFSMYPFFFIIEVINKNVSFSLVGLISTGFSAMLIGAFFNFCMGGYSRRGSFLHWLVSIGYYIITTLVACCLGLILSNVWQWVGAKGVSLFNTLKSIMSASSMSFFGVLKIVGCVIALSLLLYIGVILILIAIKEYVETFCYGALGFILFIVVAILCLVIGSQEFINGPWGQTILFITLFISMFVLDFIRVNKAEILSNR